MEIKLVDTVELMNSSNWKDRFVAEYLQTKIRYEKLHKLAIKREVGKLDTTTALGNTMLGMYGLAFTADNIGKKVGKSVQDILMDSYLAYSIGSERPIKEESDSSH